MTCPCCGGTAGVMLAGDSICLLCQRAPLHLECGRCWDHCACNPHPARLKFVLREQQAGVGSVAD